MIDEMRLESEGKMVLLVYFGNSISYEDRQCPENSFDYYWEDLGPEQLEIIRKCPVWADTVGVTFEVLEGMIEHYNERYTLVMEVTVENRSVILSNREVH